MVESSRAALRVRLLVAVALLAPAFAAPFSAIFSAMEPLQGWVDPLAAWGFWAAVEAAALALGRRAPSHDSVSALIWAAVFSLLLWSVVEQLNGWFPTWTYLGLPFAPAARLIAQGLLYSATLPTVLALAALWGIPEHHVASIQPAGATAVTAAAAGTSAILAGFLLFRSGEVAFLLSLFGVGLLVDLWNGRRLRTCLLTDLISPDRRRTAALVASAATWALYDRAMSSALPGERVYIGFHDQLLLYPLLAAAALALYPAYVALAALADKPRLDLPAQSQQGHPAGIGPI